MRRQEFIPFGDILDDEGSPTLLAAASGNTLGFAFGLLQALAQPLITVQVPDKDARSWTVHLNAFRYQSGTVNVYGTPSNFRVNPDQQTSTLYQGNPQPGIPAPTPTSLRAVIVFGTSGASEIVIVDYPPTGASFQVTCAQMRIYISPDFNQTIVAVPPGVGGFVVPSTSENRAVQYSTDPSYTHTTQSLAASPAPNSQELIGIPPRARAYRAWLTAEIDTNGLQSRPSLSQQTGSGSIVATDDRGNNATFPFEQARTQFVWPLDPRAQVIRLGNLDTVGSHFYACQFLLDLG